MIMIQKTSRVVIVIFAGFVGSGIGLRPSPVVAEERPFIARMAGNAHLSETQDPCVLRNDETVEGHATHLGSFSWLSVEFANFCTVPDGVAVTGAFTMTAANGDQLTGEYTTIGLFDADGNLIIHGVYEFTGGSRRFADASGSGDIDAIGFLTEGLPVEGTLDGTIDY
jgi:hypothetical protein